MAKRDYYEILGIPRNASADEIKKAHRKLVRKFHPDVNKSNKDAEERFKEAQEAYDILSEPGKRRNYDQFGHAGVGAGGSGRRARGNADAWEQFRRKLQQGGGGGRGGVSVEAGAGGFGGRYGRHGGFWGYLFEQLFGGAAVDERVLGAQGPAVAGRGQPRPRATPPQPRVGCGACGHHVDLRSAGGTRNTASAANQPRWSTGNDRHQSALAGVKDGSRAAHQR